MTNPPKASALAIREEAFCPPISAIQTASILGRGTRAGGVTNVNLPEAEVKKRMLKAAQRVVVLADGSKIGRTELAHLCPIDRVDLVITGESADPQVVEQLRKRECEVKIVS